MNDTTSILLTAEVQQLRRQLIEHPLYARLRTVQHVCTFMEHHVFAVWDFMTLTKALQQQLTCVTIPWLPSQDSHLSRFINEIVVAEESDDDGEGGYCSHFELYLEAMRECGANTASIVRFIQLLRRGVSPEVALGEAAVPRAAAEFVRNTLTIATTARIHEISAAFVIGREDVIPDMFKSLVESLNSMSDVSFKRFLYYLSRHIQIDEEQHAPMARYMLEKLCEDAPHRFEQANHTACRVLEARISLWDSILLQLGN